MALTVGILIIGSLYWDETGGRDRWRSWRLDMKNQAPVKVPIRYARKAASRNNTYTMVFSHMGAERFGHAIVVPCLKTIENVEDLLNEARWLWAAETKTVPAEKVAAPLSAISSSWGRVAILVRPDASVPSEMLKGWAQTSTRIDLQLMVRRGGILDIPWPVANTESGRVEFDVILATTNRPTDADPDAYSVAEAWIKYGFREYFDENRRAGIATFQDPDIARYLSAT